MIVLGDEEKRELHRAVRDVISQMYDRGCLALLYPSSPQGSANPGLLLSPKTKTAQPTMSLC